MTVLIGLFACTDSSDPVESMRKAPVVLTRHARERMACRHIDRAEIESVLATGRYVPERTRTDGPCPSHALEGPDSEGGPLRVVFAACPGETRVVTAIDLDDDFDCR